MKKGLEIERKYLIRMPDEEYMRGLPGCEIWDIVQVYLARGEDGSSRRIRRVETNGDVHYFYTCKNRINALSCVEQEGEISAEEYRNMEAMAEPGLNPIRKRRYRIPHMGQLLEVDIYSFWHDRGTLEVEMESEDQPVSIPDWLQVVREVTSDFAYKNLSLAREVPMEALD